MENVYTFYKPLIELAMLFLEVLLSQQTHAFMLAEYDILNVIGFVHQSYKHLEQK